MGSPLRAVVAGHLCLDLIPEIPPNRENITDVLQPGRLIEIGKMDLCTGGAVSNTGLALHRLGIPTRLICKVGDDPFGKIVRGIIQSHDPNLIEGIISHSEVSTSYSVILSLPGLDRIFLHHPGANHDFCAADIDFEMVSSADLFHFGYPPLMRRIYEEDGQELVKIFQRVRRLGLTTSLDMSYPDPETEAGKTNWIDFFRSVLPYTDIFSPSIEELLLMLKPARYAALLKRGAIIPQVNPALLHELSDELISLGVRIVLIKLGEMGLYLRTNGLPAISSMGKARPSEIAAWVNQEYWVASFKVQVRGTTGAGDATIAGFLAAFLRRLNPKEAARFAVAVGACNVEARDALSGIMTWEETTDRVNKGWAQNPLTLSDPNWYPDAQERLWVRPPDDQSPAALP